MAEINSSDEYRCHSCHNKTFKDFYLLLNHFQDENHIDEDDKLLCWKKGCNQYFNSLNILEKHFNEIHCLNDIKDIHINRQDNKNILSKSRERLISIGEDIVLHYLENYTNDYLNSSYEIHCDLCYKKFSSLSTLKVHYEDIHFIVLSSRAIQHWIFLLQKLHSSSSSSSSTTVPSTTTATSPQVTTNKLKRQSSSLNDLNQIKKSRSNSSENLISPTSITQYDLNNSKRQRTRITDDQLQILRSNFNINNSPSDEQILLMSQKSHLTTKVIKHWFRNTLFKERQKNKDSPYNFSNPPSTLNKIDLDEYQKTGTIIKKDIINQLSDYSDNDLSSNDGENLLSDDNDDDDNNLHFINSNNNNLLNPKQSSSSSSSASRRANRTRFSDQQLRLLQDAFESNPYPKDEHLEILSQKLKLNSRVIVVWFQNARQKARKSYENNQNDIPQPIQQIKQDKDDGYSCKNCQKLFSRFAELMKHTKQCSSSNKKSSKIIEQQQQNSSSTSINPLSSYGMLVAAAASQPQSQPQQQLTTNSTFNKKQDNYCDQCDKYFNSENDFNEHQTLHMQALINAATFFPLAAYHPAAAAAAAAIHHLSSQLFNQTQPQTHTPTTTPPITNRSSSSSNEINIRSQSLSYMSDSSNDMEEDDAITSIDSNDENRKISNLNNQKRNRTTILPEQQDYLMSKYSIESNPSRKMLEDISSEVKLKKRVVQVWFQNTRARERKGNIKIDLNDFNKKCLHCSYTFKLKSIFDNHLLTKHSDIYKTKDDIDYDLFPSDINLNNTTNNNNNDLPLDLSKSSNNINKYENEDLINEWNNDLSDQSSDDNENFKYINNTNTNNNNNNTKNLLSSQKIHLNGHLSPTNSQQSSSNGINSQRRFRTQMTPLQIKLMKHIFLEYRTPTMPECELLGKEIELQKRVVQVWFQNARAKEKKNPNFFKSDLPDELQPTNDICKLCQITYTLENPQRDHLFTSKHIENIRSILSKQIVNVSTIKDDQNSIKKNSINIKLDIDNCSTSVLDKSSKEQQNQIMSYLNLMHFMPLGMDPYNYGLMDPNIHGTPLFMLQLPPEALNKIVSLSKSDLNLTRAQYTQDGKTIQQLTDNGHTSIDYQTVDVGFACKRCNLVWPLYESCRCHALLCWQISPSTLPVSINSREDLNNLSGYIFKIEQLAYKCLSCKTSYSTIIEYEKHTKDETHLKKKRSNSTIEENDSH